MDLLDPFPAGQTRILLLAFVQAVATLAVRANLESVLFASFSFLEDLCQCCLQQDVDVG